MGEITPYNRIENFLAKGSGADVAPYNRLERILAGEDLDPTNRLEYFAKEATGGGGNPNRVETITGTLATITNDMVDNISMLPGELYAELDSGNATAELTIDGTNIGSVEVVVPLKAGNSAQLYGSVVQSTWTAEHEVTFLAAAVVNLDCSTLCYNLSALASINQIGNSTDLIPYAAMIPYTLTIIWHPLPD